MVPNRIAPTTAHVVAVLALSALGCGSSSSTPACAPDLSVNWQIVDSGSGVVRTCSQVGATTIRVSVNGQSTDFSCPAADSAGVIPIAFDLSGQYSVTVVLLDGGTPLAQSPSSTVAVDCSGRSATPVLTLAVDSGCTPDLTISWEIRSNLSAGNPLITCDEAGGADTVTAVIGGSGVLLTSFDSPCPATATQGSFVVPLAISGTYNVSLELTAGDVKLSETPLLVQPVDCSGVSATPVADLFVNF